MALKNQEHETATSGVKFRLNHELDQLSPGIRIALGMLLILEKGGACSQTELENPSNIMHNISRT